FLLLPGLFRLRLPGLLLRLCLPRLRLLRRPVWLLRRLWWLLRRLWVLARPGGIFLIQLLALCGSAFLLSTSSASPRRRSTGDSALRLAVIGSPCPERSAATSYARAARVGNTSAAMGRSP